MTLPSVRSESGDLNPELFLGLGFPLNLGDGLRIRQSSPECFRGWSRASCCFNSWLRGPVAQRLEQATHNLGFCSESLTIRKGSAFKRESEQIRGNLMVFVEAIRAAYGPFIGDG